MRKLSCRRPKQRRKTRPKNLIVLGKERSHSPTPKSTITRPTTFSTPSRSKASSP
jgi:hypothetical protein